MPLFPSGQVVVTPGALRALESAGASPADLLRRHLNGNWGVVNEDNRLANDLAIRRASRIFSAYCLKEGTKVWVITEVDRSATTVLLPDEY
jgi:hypothetical protein